MRSRQPDAAAAASALDPVAGPGGDSRPAPTTHRRRGNHLAARAARWSVRHRKLAVAGWLLAVVALVFVGSSIGTHQLKQQDWNLGQDAKAKKALAAHGFVDRDGEYVLIQYPAKPAGGMVADGRVQATVAEIVRRIEATHQVTSILAPVAVPGATANPGLVSTDGRSVLVSFDLLGSLDDAEDNVGPVMDAVKDAAKAHPGISVEQFGVASSSKALDGTVGKDFKRAEYLSVPITLAILLVVFGAVVAALVPVGLALTAFVGAIGVVAFTSRLMATNQIATSVMLLIGLAVGVDYALFYIRREREERAAGHSAKRALEIAAETSGHTVLVSGLTVAVSLAGLMLTGLTVFTGVAVGTIVVVLVALLGSITVLPALLSLLGDRIELGRLPWHHSAVPGTSRERKAARKAAKAARRAGIVLDDDYEATPVIVAADRARQAANPSRVRLLDRLMRRPAAVAVVSGGLLLALAAPTLKLHTSDLEVSDLPRNLPIVHTYDRLLAAFPGGPVPALIAVTAPDVTTPRVAGAIQDLRAQALAAHVGFEPVIIDVSADKRVARIVLPLAGSGDDRTSLDAVKRLRDNLVPATIGTVPGAQAYVGGDAGASLDFNHQLRSRTPLVIGFVLLLAFALLYFSFRSAAVAGVAVGLNLLSVGAAYGLLELIFQHHWADGLLGFTATGSVVSWLPLMLFVMLFGLSMDYQVFLLSRIREARQSGLDMRSASLAGLRNSAGVVTSAAVIMVAVFSIFATLSQVSMKQLGVGLGAAILLDATIIRVFLMPALLTLLGDRVWRPKASPPRRAGTAADAIPTQAVNRPTRVH
jgi:RND superfamily putative drug exporter